MKTNCEYFLRFACTFLFLLVLSSFYHIEAQDRVIQGKVVDKSTDEPLGSVSIRIFKYGKISGSVSNNEGGFRIVLSAQADSVKFSFIGYRSQVIDVKQKLTGDFLKISLELQPKELSEVIIKPISAEEIIRNAIAATRQMLPKSDYENDFFYREVIRDRENYFSVAEAIFLGQFKPSKNDYALKLEKGRSKEDVTYTRLFEDYHPGGGPEALFDKDLVNGLPAFLTSKKSGLFLYHKDSIINFDNRSVYVVSFDQRPGVHEALDKGKVYIDAEDFSLIRYETENSPLGVPYMKDLTGTDKLFAELLHIDFKRKGWTSKAEFTKDEGSLYLQHAYAEYKIDYKQPKKDLDLDLVITTEMVTTGQASPIKEAIVSGQRWKSKNIVANLPTDFDAGFWGNSNIISPTSQIENIIATIGAKNNDVVTDKLSNNWQYFQKDFFVAFQKHDTIALVPVMKGSWEDDETAGMLYQDVTRDFSIEAELAIGKRSNPGAQPDIGFQQAGIIVRDSNSNTENSILFCIGTGGNDHAKYFLRNTEKGRSKGPIDKIDTLHQWLRLEKTGNIITSYIKQDEKHEWKKIASYKLGWTDKPLQVGLMVMASFAGSGPKMKPDMKAVFTHIIIKHSDQ